MMPPRPTIRPVSDPCVAARLLPREAGGKAALPCLLRADAGGAICGARLALLPQFAALGSILQALLTRLLCITAVLPILDRLAALLPILDRFTALLTSLLSGFTALLTTLLDGCTALLTGIADGRASLICLSGLGGSAAMLARLPCGGAPGLSGPGACLSPRPHMRPLCRGARSRGMMRPRSAGPWRRDMPRGATRGRGAWRLVSRRPRVRAVLARRCVGRLNERSSRYHGSRGEKLFDHGIVPQIRWPPRAHLVDG